MLVAYLIGVIIVFWLVHRDYRVRSPLLTSLIWPLMLITLPIIHIVGLFFTFRSHRQGRHEEKERQKAIAEQQKRLADIQEQERKKGSIRALAEQVKSDQTTDSLWLDCEQLFAGKVGFAKGFQPCHFCDKNTRQTISNTFICDNCKSKYDGAMNRKLKKLF